VTHPISSPSLEFQTPCLLYIILHSASQTSRHGGHYDQARGEPPCWVSVLFLRRSTSLQRRPPSTKSCRIRTTTIGTVGNGPESCRRPRRCYIGLFAVQLPHILKPNLLICFCPTRNVELKDNTVIVVLGASGDLAKKKTVSSLESRLLGAVAN
jgi:hypothetical protein